MHVWEVFGAYGTITAKGDYNCIYSISEDEISTIKAPARELIETIEVLLAES